MLLTLMIFLPIIGGVLSLFVPKEKIKIIQLNALIFSGIVLILSIYMITKFDTSTSSMQFVEKYRWIPSLNVNYYLGIDGLSVSLVFLTAFLSFLSIIASFNITLRVKEYFFFFLLLETGMIGVFCALDFFLFYIFWEVMLVPMYFLIGIWGGPRKEYAAIKFFLYTLFGSVIMLLAIIGLYFLSTPHTFDMCELSTIKIGKPLIYILYLAFYIGFAIKVPVFPFHTWLPDAHVEAPTAVSVILAGVLLKMGIYGMLRVSYSIFPEAAYDLSTPLAILAMINIVYGALVSMAQTDLKKMIAYSSINHMGYALLGMSALNSIGIQGCILQMFNHGIITGSLFLLVGVIYDRAHTRDINGFGGLATITPVYFGLMSVSSLASLGLPSLAGFVSELLCFLGAFNVHKVITIISISGVVITTAFFLNMIKKVFLGQVNEKWKNLPDMDLREKIAIVPLTITMIVLGIFPQILLSTMTVKVQALVELLTKYIK
jgi:NADH-quinone oxidoreductase subunit M